MTEFQDTTAETTTTPTAGAETEYDRVLYPGGCHPETWPDHVAAIAILLGMDAPATENCRVLEVGCGEGGNLIPMALTMPNARLVGIDLAERPVDQARARAMAVGLDNVEFRRLNIMEAGPDLGQFDYIIAHGVYSWIPPAVRDRLLALCKSNLSPNGVAYVSYNAMPGGAIRQMARHIAKYHLAQRRISDPAQQVAETRALLQHLGEVKFVAPYEWAGYRQAIREEANLAAATSESVVYHDTLAEVNDAFYFHEFAAEAARHGLQFVGESNVTDLFNPYFPPAVRQSMESIPPGDVVAREQYADFLKGRTFRRTLLCHAGVVLDRPPQPVRVRSLYAGSVARTEPPLVPGPSLIETIRNPAASVTFVRGMGATMTTADPVTKAALLHLIGSWPNFIAFDELVATARKYGGVPAEAAPAPPGMLGDAVARSLAEVLLSASSAKLVVLRARPLRVAVRGGERPVASPIARLQAASSPTAHLTNLLGENLNPPADSVGRRLLPLLDGSRDRAALLDELVALARTGEAEILDNGVRVEDPERIRALFRPELERQLRELAVNALLIA